MCVFLSSLFVYLAVVRCFICIVFIVWWKKKSIWIRAKIDKFYVIVFVSPTNQSMSYGICFIIKLLVKCLWFYHWFLHKNYTYQQGVQCGFDLVWFDTIEFEHSTFDGRNTWQLSLLTPYNLLYVSNSHIIYNVHLFAFAKHMKSIFLILFLDFFSLYVRTCARACFLNFILFFYWKRLAFIHKIKKNSGICGCECTQPWFMRFFRVFFYRIVKYWEWIQIFSYNNVY